MLDQKQKNFILENYREGKSINAISKELKISWETVKNYLLRENIKLEKNINQFQKEQKLDYLFEKVADEDTAYWLGFLYADGAVGLLNNNVELSLAIKDISHLEKFKNFIKSPKDINISTVIVDGKCFKRCRFTVTDKHFKTQLIK